MARERKHKADKYGFAEQHYFDNEEETARATAHLPADMRYILERINAFATDPVDFEAVIKKAQERCAELDPHRTDLAKGLYLLEKMARRVLELKAKRISKKEAKRILKENEEFSSDYFAALITFDVATLKSAKLPGRQDLQRIEAINRRIGAYCVFWKLVSSGHKAAAFHGYAMNIAGNKDKTNERQKKADERNEEMRQRHKRMRDEAKKIKAKNPKMLGKRLRDEIRRRHGKTEKDFGYSESTMKKALKGL